jgi:hypothetical protein
VSRIALAQAALALVALTLTLAPAGGATRKTVARPAPKLTNPTQRAKPLLHRFFVLLQKKDFGGLRQFLSRAFQVQRADGSSSDKTRYLANLPVVKAFRLEGEHATQAGGTLVVRYVATVEGLVNGQPYTPGPAPRLSVFSWNGNRWQLAAHANFNPLKG